MQVRLKQIDQDLLPQIRLIDRACLGDFWSMDAYKREIDSPNSSLLALITAENIVLGFGCLWSILEEAHITILAVRPEYQQQGMGRYLVWGLLQEANAKGLEWATLEVRASNHIAINLYESFGFVVIGRRPNYYQVSNEDALILWRKGLHLPEFPHMLQAWQQDIQSRLAAKGWEILSTDTH
jgi:[ribosomal protein S18]-alanine N-acetyltransferase